LAVATKKPIKIGHVAEKALDLLRRHPSGLTMAEMRSALEVPGESQEHFNRRVRDIRKLFDLETVKRGGETVYVLGAERARADAGAVSERLRAEVLHKAHGRCQMCGQSIERDGVKLQADHKIPQSWGGPTNPDNLWAICESCNRGKRNFFATFDAEEMKRVINIESVHERIAEFLRLHMPEPVPAYAIDFVANVKDQQLDWRKRLRELRYAPVGLDIDVSKKRDGKGVQSYYALKSWRALPADLVKLIKDFERRKGRSTDG
jgi:hypothetical protein